MDPVIKQHMNKWIDRVFVHNSDDLKNLVALSMELRFESDPEYWGNQPYNRLHDTCAQEGDF